LKAPGTKRFTLKYGKPLSSFAFNFDLRRYTAERDEARAAATAAAFSSEGADSTARLREELAEASFADMARMKADLEEYYAAEMGGYEREVEALTLHVEEQAAEAAAARAAAAAGEAAATEAVAAREAAAAEAAGEAAAAAAAREAVAAEAAAVGAAAAAAAEEAAAEAAAALAAAAAEAATATAGPECTTLVNAQCSSMHNARHVKGCPLTKKRDMWVYNMVGDATCMIRLALGPGVVRRCVG